MKSFLIKSPCDRANGLNGNYYSVAFTDEHGNVIKGIGDHISELSYGIKNVFDSEGSSFSDEDRFISIKEVEMSESRFDKWMQEKIENDIKWEKRNAEELELFTHDPYNYIYGKKDGQAERLAAREEWKAKNHIPQFKYYSFLNLIQDEEN